MGSKGGDWAGMSQANVATVRAALEGDSGFLAVFDDYEVENHEYLDAGSFVLVEQRLRRRTEPPGLSPEIRYWSVFALRSGKVLSWRFFRAREEALEAAGLRE